MQSDYSPLFFAAASGDLDEIRRLAPECDLSDRNQALAQAAALNQFAAADLLIEFGADASGGFSDSYGSVLFPSCEWMNPEGIKWLLEHGADVHRTNSRGESALDHLIASHIRSPNKYRCIGLLIKAGINPPDDAVMAIHKGNPQALRDALTKDPASLNRPLDLAYGQFPLRGASLLHLAAEYNELEVATELIRAGLDVNTTAVPHNPEPVWPTDLSCSGGQTALFHAAGFSKEMQELLLGHGAKTDIRANFFRDGEALHLTAQDFFAEVDNVEGNRFDEIETLRLHKA